MKTKRGLSLFVLITFGTMLLFHSMGQERRNQKTMVVGEDVRELLEEEKRNNLGEKTDKKRRKGNTKEIILAIVSTVDKYPIGTKRIYLIW